MCGICQKDTWQSYSTALEPMYTQALEKGGGHLLCELLEKNISVEGSKYKGFEAG